jgi:hypothetical protein
MWALCALLATQERLEEPPLGIVEGFALMLTVGRAKGSSTSIVKLAVALPPGPFTVIV